MNIAVITGASSGLGREFALLIDTSEVDEIWLIARRHERLLAVAAQLHTEARVITGDVTNHVFLHHFADMLQHEDATIRFLINAAGFGKIGAPGDISSAILTQMIDTNCSGAVSMTEVCLPFMMRGSHIGQICSVAAFQPLPYFNVYSATKAFLYRYSRALAVELAPRGITVTAVCPYWVKDTEFIDVAKEDTKNGSYFQSFPFSMNQKDVVKTAYKAICRGKAVSTPGFMATLDRLGSFLPAGLMMRIVQWFY